MKRTPESSPDIPKNIFKVGETITCPSDGTGIKWKIYEIRDDGFILAIVKYEEKYPSEQYPKTMEISPYALAGWKKVEEPPKN